MQENENRNERMVGDMMVKKVLIERVGGRAWVTYTPIRGMVSGKYFSKNSMTWSPVVSFSNSSKGMKRVQVNVLSWEQTEGGHYSIDRSIFTYG